MKKNIKKEKIIQRKNNFSSNILLKFLKKVKRSDVIKVILMIILIGIVITVLMRFNSVDTPKYEYYDLNGEYGKSPSCKSTLSNLICDTEKGWIEVAQYSEVTYD